MPVVISKVGLGGGGGHVGLAGRHGSVDHTDVCNHHHSAKAARVDEAKTKNKKQNH